MAVSGYTLSQCRHDHFGALALLDRTIELAPNSAFAFAYRAAVQVRCERYADALRDAQLSLRLSPLDRHAWFPEMISAQAHYALGELQQAIAAASRVAARLPSNAVNFRILIAALVEAGSHDEAKARAEPLMKDGQIDFSWILIKTLEKLGLAWNVKVPDAARIEAKRVGVKPGLGG